MPAATDTHAPCARWPIACSASPARCCATAPVSTRYAELRIAGRECPPRCRPLANHRLYCRRGLRRLGVGRREVVRRVAVRPLAGPHVDEPRPPRGRHLPRVDPPPAVRLVQVTIQRYSSPSTASCCSTLGRCAEAARVSRTPPGLSACAANRPRSPKTPPPTLARALGGIVAMMSSCRSDHGLEFADRRGEQIRYRSGVRRFGDGLFPRLLLLDALDGPGQGRRLAGLDGLHRPALDLGGFVPDPVGVGDGDMPALHGRRQVRIVLDGRRPLRSNAAIPSSTRPQPPGKLRQLADPGKLRQLAQFLPSATPAGPGRSRPSRPPPRPVRRCRQPSAAPRPGSPASPRPAPAGSRPCGVAGDSSSSRPARRPGRPRPEGSPHGTGTPARSHASARFRPSSSSRSSHRWRPAPGSRSSRCRLPAPRAGIGHGRRA